MCSVCSLCARSGSTTRLTAGKALAGSRAASSVRTGRSGRETSRYFQGALTGRGSCGDTGWGGAAVPDVLRLGERAGCTTACAGLFPLLVRAERVAAPGRSRPGTSVFCHDPFGSQPGASRAGARRCPGTDPGRREHRSSSPVSRAGVWGRGSLGQSLACGCLSLGIMPCATKLSGRRHQAAAGHLSQSSPRCPMTAAVAVRLLQSRSCLCITCARSLPPPLAPEGRSYLCRGQCPCLLLPAVVTDLAVHVLSHIHHQRCSPAFCRPSCRI